MQAFDQCGKASIDPCTAHPRSSVCALNSSDLLTQGASDLSEGLIELVLICWLLGWPQGAKSIIEPPRDEMNMEVRNALGRSGSGRVNDIEAIRT